MSQAGVRELTGSEAGFSGAEQIRIALKCIEQKQGAAQINDIYSAVEAALTERDPQYRLSEQGKASLRFFVNRVAVDLGYIRKHDSRKPGWRITPKGRQHIRTSPRAALNAQMVSQAGRNFQLALTDVYTLLDAEERLTPKDDGATDSFTRAALILTVTAWETFVEDTVRFYFAQRLESMSHQRNPEAMLREISQLWLAIVNRPPRLRNNVALPVDADGWQEALLLVCENDVQDLNAPTSENVDRLFNRYLGVSIASLWHWTGVTVQQARRQLDDLVKRRNELVHRAKSASAKAAVSRDRLIEYLTLVDQVAWVTEVELHNRLSEKAD